MFVEPDGLISVNKFFDDAMAGIGPIHRSAITEARLKDFC